MYPLDIGKFLATQFSSSSPDIVLVKIDTEGYEPIILEAILDYCKLSSTTGNAVVVQNFIIEVTSKSWSSFEVQSYESDMHCDNTHLVYYQLSHEPAHYALKSA